MRKKQQKNELVRIGALWTKKRGAKVYYSGEIDADDTLTLKLLIFANSYKNKKKDPDWIVYRLDVE